MVQITAAQFKPEKYSGPDYSRTLLHTMVQITAAHCCTPWSRLQPHIAAYHGPEYSRTLLQIYSKYKGMRIPLRGSDGLIVLIMSIIVGRKQI
jgi:hypothetical protein